MARAYLPRTAKNQDFITELDSGIKKEVSVGCAVNRLRCSICGEDLKKGACRHQKGKTYDGRLCCTVLDDPYDAYEWSFVAVPAQREAGVIKMYTPTDTEEGTRTSSDIIKAFSEGKEMTLSPEECAEISGCLRELAKRRRPERTMSGSSGRRWSGFLCCPSRVCPRTSWNGSPSE